MRLITGFEPFGGSPTNSSELVVTALGALGEPGVVTAVLPTSYRRAEARLFELLDLHRPQMVLLLGLHGGAAEIRLEQLALNLDDCGAADNDGELRARRPILAEAPAAYRSSLPLDRMAAVARQQCEDVVFSHDPGCFICNHVFFHAAHRAATETPSYRCGFVHLPAMEESSDRLARVVAIVRTWVTTL